jgi:transposase
MGILAEQADHVIGVDTHRDSHSAAIVDAVTGAVAIARSVSADAFGHKRLLQFAKLHATSRRVWAIESSGSYGAGLATFLLEHGEWVVEVERPVRPARRNGAKSDELDAVRAAREALTRDHLAQPRRRGDREAVRVLLVTRRGAMRARTKAINHLKALVITAREELRHQLRRHDTDALIARCARLRTLPSHSAEHRATVIALRHTARRILMLEAEANDLETEIEQLIKTNLPWLLDEVGVGPISAAQLFCSWSHPGRLRSDAAFCMLGGRRSDPCLLGADRPLPAQPRRRPPAQLRPAHHRSHPPQPRSRHPRLRRQTSRRRQDTTRDQTLSEALRRPPPLPAARSQRPRHPRPSRTPQPHTRHLPLTDIEASGVLCWMKANRCRSPAVA